MSVNIFGVEVSGLAESVLASGFPMQVYCSDWDYDMAVFKEWRYGGNVSDGQREWCEKQWKRACTLGKCEGGESHDCYLCGITVAFNITAPRYWYPEMQRYHFADIVSSTSTMHRLRYVVDNILCGKMDWTECFCDSGINEGLIKCALGAMNVVMNDGSLSDEEKVRQIKGLLPESYLQTCRITTNYRQLKTWRRQRSKHRLQEWQEVCAWIGTLPWFDELTGF